MINRHEFQILAKKFRGGRISLTEFTDTVFGKDDTAPEALGFDTDPVDLRLPVRPENSHKGDFGRILMIGGSQNMPGAIALSGLAALKSGAGVVSIATPEPASQLVASFSPCLITESYGSASGLFAPSAADAIIKQCEQADVIAVGPGMGISAACQNITSRIYRELPQPVVIDADGLNNLVASNVDWNEHAGERILTPHPGEFERMTGEKNERRTDMEDHANEFARRAEITIVLKGHHSHVTNGQRMYRNESGNAGMATAGSGDVLTGIVASLIGQRMDVYESAAIGTYLHGLAGDLYNHKRHSASLIATDLIDYLPQAMYNLSRQD